MVKAVNNSKVDIKNLVESTTNYYKNTVIKNNLGNDTLLDINLEEMIFREDFVSCKDRIVDNNGEYNKDSLEKIIENDLIRDKNGNRIKQAYDNYNDLIDSIESLNKKYSKYPGFKYYNQNLYPENYKYSSIQQSGCCPTCFAMIASYLTGKDILPTDVIDAFSPYCFPEGTDVTGNCFPDVSNKYGLETKRIEWRDKSAIINELKEGNPIVLNVEKGEFTGSGHYIVLLGLDDNEKVIVADPNSVYNSTRTYNVDDLISQTHDIENAAWSFKRK